MRRGRLGLAVLLSAAGLILPGCATKPVVYGPVGPEAPYGYKDHANSDGGFTVSVFMPGHATPVELRGFFERRAAEICPSGTERTNIFKTERKEYTYLNYGTVSSAQRVWTGTELQGYVYCKVTAAAPSAATIEPAPAA